MSGETSTAFISRQEISKRLAKTVLSFQDAYLSRDQSPSGLLCQVWLPEREPGGRVTLKTKGLPFCVAGMGDLLALFRCISCRFSFPVDDPAHLGAPGRVFITGEPELSCNVQHYPNGAYLRRAEAEQCNVQSSMLLPVFVQPPIDSGSKVSSGDGANKNSPNHSAAVAVIEVVQTSEDMQFLVMAELLSRVLKICQLYTSSAEAVRRCVPTQNTQLILPNQTGVLGPYPPNKDSGGSQSTEAGGARAASPRNKSTKRSSMDAARLNAVPESGPASSGHSEDISMGDADGESDDDNNQGDGAAGKSRRSASGKPAAAAAGTTATTKKARTGNPGKPGTKLRLEDLQSQFGVGIKEAAARLGICPTTLKRACRRHGIQRWPRRALLKVNQALDEMERRQPFTDPDKQQQQQQLMVHQVAPGGGMGNDTRWTTLASFIPTFQGLPNPEGGLMPLPYVNVSGAVLPAGAAGNGPSPRQQAAGTSWPPQPSSLPSWLLQGPQAAGQQKQQLPTTSDTSLPSGMVAVAPSRRNINTTGNVPQTIVQSGVIPAAAAGYNNEQFNAQAMLALQQQQQMMMMQHQLQQRAQLVPNFLKPSEQQQGGNRAGEQLAAPATTGTDLNGPILQFPPGIDGPTLSDLQGLSNLSLPSLNVGGMSFMGGGGGGGTLNGAASTGTLLGGGEVPLSPDLKHDDVGLLDTSILELLLSEDNGRKAGLSTDEPNEDPEGK